MAVPNIQFGLNPSQFPAALRRHVQRLSQDINSATSTLANAASASNLKFCRLYRATDQALADNATTDVIWTAESTDVQNWHDTGTNPERITVDAAGLYEITVSFVWSGGASVGSPRIQKNGSTTYTFYPRTTFQTPDVLQFTVCDVAAANDYYTAGVTTLVGSSLAIAGGATNSWICVKLIGVV